MRRLNALKNFLWALGILLCLVVMLIALFYAAFTPYRGEKERGGVQLGEVSEKVKADKEDESAQSEAQALPEGTLLRLADSADGGQAYLDSLTFLVDSSLTGLRSYGLLADGLGTTQVWAGPEGSISADSLSSCLIRYPQDGSEIGAATAAMVARPSRLVICLGGDGLGQIEEDSFKSGYRALLRDLKNSSPDTTLILCPLPSVTADYGGGQGLSAERMGEANRWIRELCSESGAWYADYSALLMDAEGCLRSEYAEPNGRSLNAAGLGQLLGYLRSHTA